MKVLPRARVRPAYYLPISALVFVFIAAGLSAESFNWPVDNQLLTATFGENRWNHFHDGIDLGGGDQQVHASDAGEVIFVQEEGSDSRDLPTGLGSFVVLDHHNGYRTVYAHLARDTIPKDVIDVEKGEIIGTEGDTGDSLGKHLHFEIIDTKQEEVLNPLLLLPPLAAGSHPVISAVSLGKDKSMTRLDAQTTVDPGTYELVVDASDPSPFVDYLDSMGPYRMEVSLNGKTIFSVSYDGLKVEAGKARIEPSGQYAFDGYYLGPTQVRLGEITVGTGETRLDVVVSSFGGGSVESSYDIASRVQS